MTIRLIQLLNTNVVGLSNLEITVFSFITKIVQFWVTSGVEEGFYVGLWRFGKKAYFISFKKHEKVDLYNNFIKRMIVRKSSEISSINFKYRIKSLPKDTFKENTLQTLPEKSRKRVYSLFENEKLSGLKNSINNQRKGLAGLKPLDWKRQTYFNQKNCLVIRPLASTKSNININKNTNQLKLNFNENSKESLTCITNNKSFRQSGKSDITSCLQFKDSQNTSTQGLAFENIPLKNLLSLSHTNSDNEIGGLDQVLQTQIQLNKQPIEKNQLIRNLQRRNRIQSKTVDLFFLVCISPQLTDKCQKLKNDASKLQEKYNKLKNRVNQLDQANKQSNVQFTTKIKFLAEFEEKYRKILDQTKVKQEHLQRVKKELERKTTQLQMVLQKGKQIESYVANQEKRKLLHEVSQDYKKREGDMYDYALQMQTNTWASGLKEVKPFTQQEKYLQQRMNSLYRQLTNDQDIISFEKKCNQIKDFVFKMYASFKRMNDDMRTVNEFKTKCIRQFVLRMQKWLQNWELKQQFLVNLRQEFALEQTRINQNLVEFQKVMESKGVIMAQEQKFIDIKTSLQKLRQNYRLGNSFY